MQAMKSYIRIFIYMYIYIPNELKRFTTHTHKQNQRKKPNTEQDFHFNTIYNVLICLIFMYLMTIAKIKEALITKITTCNIALKIYIRFGWTVTMC